MTTPPPILMQALREGLRESGFPGSGLLLAAVSGGADSIALLHGLASLLPPGALAVAHLNHRIRGAAAGRDAAFVRARCQALGLPLHEAAADVPRLAKARGLSLEMAAREARYGFFRDVRVRTGARAVATAHTADDQAETVLLKLVRGAGPRGLGGMAPRSDVLGVPVIRPLLGVTRRQVLDYLGSIGAEWREDRTNRDPHPLRNRIRHGLLPLLEKGYNPRIREALVRSAAILRDEEEWLRPLVEKAARRLVRGGGLDACRLRELPPALARRVIRDWLLRGGVREEHVDFDLVARLEALAAGGGAGGSVDAGGGRRVVAAYGAWRLAAGAVGGPPGETPIRLPGVTDLPDWGLRVTVRRTRGFVRRPDDGIGVVPCRARLDAVRATGAGLVVRSWRAGDRIALPSGTRKLQDLFTDARVPREDRLRVPVLATAAGEVVWVAGGAVARDWRVPGAGAASFGVSLACRGC